MVTICTFSFSAVFMISLATCVTLRNFIGTSLSSPSWQWQMLKSHPAHWDSCTQDTLWSLFQMLSSKELDSQTLPEGVPWLLRFYSGLQRLHAPSLNKAILFAQKLPFSSKCYLTVFSLIHILISTYFSVIMGLHLNSKVPAMASDIFY